MLTTNFKILKEKELYSVLNRPDKYKILTKKLGRVKKYGLETPITLLQVLDILGFDDALKVLDYAIIPEQVKEAKLFVMKLKADYAERVLHIFERVYPDNDKPRRAIEITRKYIIGEATKEELDAAREGANRAVWASRAAWAAWDAADAGDEARTATVAAGTAGVAAWVAGAAWVADDEACKAERQAQEKILMAYLEEMDKMQKKEKSNGN